MKINLIVIIFLISILLLISVSFAAITITCNQICTVGNCQCSITGCTSGVFAAYTTSDCSGDPSDLISFSGGSIAWAPSEARTYYLRFNDCDGTGTNSDCIPQQVSTSSTSSSTTTTTIQCCLIMQDGRPGLCSPCDAQCTPENCQVTTTTIPPPTTATFFGCKECRVWDKCSCELYELTTCCYITHALCPSCDAISCKPEWCNWFTNCTEGMWIVKNKQGNTLQSPIIKEVSKNNQTKSVEFTPNTTGKVDVWYICLNSSVSNASMIIGKKVDIYTDSSLSNHSIIIDNATVEVKEKFLRCPNECKKSEQCSCTVNGCKKGNLLATLNNVVLADKNVTSSSNVVTFTPSSTGKAKVNVYCNDPVKNDYVEISVTGPTQTSITTSTTDFSGGGFIYSEVSKNFYLDYNNNYGKVRIIFIITKTGEVDESNTISLTVEKGSEEITEDFSCNDRSGTYYISWQAYSYSDTSLSNPLTWSKSTERVRVTC